MALEKFEFADGSRYELDLSNPEHKSWMEQKAKSLDSKKSPSFGDMTLGAGETALAVGTGIPAGLWGGIVGLSHGLRPGNYGTPEGARKASEIAAQSMQANTYVPRTETGREMTESVGRLAQNLAPLIGLPGEVAAVARMAKPAATQMKSGVIDAITPTIDPEVARLARKAQEYNIPLRPDQLGRSKAGKVFGKFSEQDVPFSSSKAGQRSDAIHASIIKQIDPDASATRITSEVFADAMEKRGQQIGDIAGRNRITDTHSLSKQLNAVVKDATPYGEDTARLVKARVKDIKSLIGDDGSINGSDFRQWNTRVLEDIRNTKDVKQASLGKLQDAVMSAFEQNLSAEDLPLWKEARQSYAVGKQLVPLVAESTTGELNLSKLLGTVTKGKDAKSRMAYGRGGEIGDIAKLAKEFGDDVGSISLPERMSAYALLNAVGKTTAGVAAWPFSTAYNVLGPKYAKWLTKRTEPVLPRRPTIDPSSLKAQLNQNWLGDLTPEWTTSPGAAPRGLMDAIEPTGLVRALGEDPLVSSRNKSRPQMPVQPGIPGVDDVAINGGLWNTWTDAAPGALDRMKSAPMAVGGIELSRIVNMPKSQKKTKLLLEFRKRYPVAHDYIDDLMKREQ